MTQTPIRMCVEETINCYCFNPSCRSSIFYPETCVVTRKNLNQVLSGGLVCEGCKSELVSKPVLEMKNAINRSLTPADTHQYVVQPDYSRRVTVKQS